MILTFGFLKALEKTLFHFFWRVGFLIVYFNAVACLFRAVSVVNLSNPKTVRSKHKSFKFAEG